MVSTQTLIAVVDDDVSVAKVLGALLRQAHYDVEVCASGERALRCLASRPVDLVITDLRMPEMDGFALLNEVGARWSDVPVVMLTAHGTTKNAVEAMRRGAADFLTKPFDREEVLATVARVLERSAADRAAPPTVRTTSGDGWVANAPPMRDVASELDKAARTKATVLLLGETGTGKEVAARRLHAASDRRDMPFVAVHCGAIPENLIESELFGYEKGAFTGANTRRPGRVELAEGSTLFLDEVGDMSPAMQVKLLRLLQEREYQPLGATNPRKADVRFVAATHRDLETRVAEGHFREDLYYRLAILPIVLPPLRERRSDIPELVAVLAARVAEREGRAAPAFSGDAMGVLTAHDWPGNVRQLANLVERLVILASGPEITATTIRDTLARRGSGRPAAPQAVAGHNLEAHRADAERRAILSALEASGGNRSMAARLLGVSRRTLYTKVQTLGIDA